MYTQNLSKSPKPAAFTLIELLLVMAVIAVLSSLALVVVAEAQADARRGATENRINQISNILELRMENLLVRRLPLRDIFDYVINNPVANDNGDPALDARDLRRRILLDILNVEMPRSWENISFQAGAFGGSGEATYPSSAFVSWVENEMDFISDDDGLSIVDVMAEHPPAASTRFIQYDADGAIDPNSSLELYPEGLNHDGNNIEDRRRASSEYLYMILQGTEIDGLLGASSLGTSAFGDTDGDGFMEVLDSWGDPIGFQFAMYDPAEGLVLDAATGQPASLDVAYVLSDGSAISVRHVRLLLVSGGNGGELISNIVQ